MPPKTRNASKIKPMGGASEDISSASKPKPKLFPLFYKKVDNATTSQGTVDSKSAPGASVDALQALGDVSSPPRSEQDHININDAPQESETSKLHSIFTLPVPKLKAKASTSSLKTIRPARKAATTVKATEPVASTSKPSGPALIQSSRHGQPASRSKRKTEVIHLSSDDEVSAIINMRNEPIILSSSPVKGASDLVTPSKPVHEFFAPRKGKASNNATSPLLIDEDELMGGCKARSMRIEPPESRQATSGGLRAVSPVAVLKATRRKSAPSSLEPPWPSSESQHVRGAQESFMPFASDFPSRRRNPQFFQSLCDTSLVQVLPLPPLPRPTTCTPSVDASPEGSSAPFSIPKEYRIIPAFRAVLSSLDRSDTKQQAIYENWADHWRPRRANQVLGNEAHAQYLKAWLHTLELGTEVVVSSVPSASQSSPASSPPGMGGAKGEGKILKRPVVLRKVEKARPKKRRKVSGYGTDDWIASEDSSSEDAADYDEPLRFQPSVSPCKRAPHDIEDPRRSTSPEDGRFLPGHFSPLTNTILLTGPSGSGKTAAVYACAEELGWEVYEVYPGMGKRSGANLTAIVDGVSKNHVLGGLGATPAPRTSDPKLKEAHRPDMKMDHPKLKPKALQSFFKQSKQHEKQSLQAATPNLSFGSVNEPILLEQPAPLDNDPLVAWISSRDDTAAAHHSPLALAKPPAARNGKLEPPVRQSLILLEEADILFAEDKNFWPAVVDLIAASRRPIVITCNDATLLPLHDLPLQTTLYFEPPPKPMMSAYLRSLARTSGCVISEDTADLIVDASMYKPLSADLPDQPTHPLPSQEPPRPDLRRAINQLQFWSADRSQSFDDHVAATIAPEDEGWTDSQDRLCDWSSQKNCCDTMEEDNGTPGRTMGALCGFMDAVSWADAYIDRRPMAALDAFSIDRYDATLDDEVGYKHIAKVDYSAEFSDFGCGVTFYTKDNQMAVDCVRLARGCLRDQGLGTLPRGDTCSILSSIRFFDSTRVYQARAHHQRALVEFIDDVVQTIDIPLLPRPAMLLDYVPHIQWMVDIDDTQEEMHKAAIGSSKGSVMGLGRRGGVRQSSRIGARVPATHERYISLSAEGLHAARGTRLVG
ncbi:hypothetical protein FRB94_000114 [Tulasnella sp. JGI-2019a]|nr:hypothetical protein FRB94_000114 [Tulasnella sp. JGI-2019a]